MLVTAMSMAERHTLSNRPFHVYDGNLPAEKARERTTWEERSDRDSRRRKRRHTTSEEGVQ